MTQTTNETERYLELTPKSRAIWEDAKNYLPGGDSRNSIFWEPYPFFVESSSGCHVIDADGVDRVDQRLNVGFEQVSDCYPNHPRSSEPIKSTSVVRHGQVVGAQEARKYRGSSRHPSARSR